MIRRERVLFGVGCILIGLATLLVAVKIGRQEPPRVSKAGELARDLSEVTTAYSRMWDEEREGLIGGAYDAAREDWRVRYNAAVREVYARHGESAPDYFKTPSTP